MMAALGSMEKAMAGIRRATGLDSVERREGKAPKGTSGTGDVTRRRLMFLLDSFQRLLPG